VSGKAARKVVSKRAHTKTPVVAGRRSGPQRNPSVPKKPLYLTEDEGDVMISVRRLTESSVTLEEYLRSRGHELDS